MKTLLLILLFLFYPSVIYASQNAGSDPFKNLPSTSDIHKTLLDCDPDDTVYVHAVSAGSSCVIRSYCCGVVLDPKTKQSKYLIKKTTDPTKRKGTNCRHQYLGPKYCKKDPDKTCIANLNNNTVGSGITKKGLFGKIEQFLFGGLYGNLNDNNSKLLAQAMSAKTKSGAQWECIDRKNTGTGGVKSKPDKTDSKSQTPKPNPTRRVGPAYGAPSAFKPARLAQEGFGAGAQGPAERAPVVQDTLPGAVRAEARTQTNRTSGQAPRINTPVPDRYLGPDRYERMFGEQELKSESAQTQDIHPKGYLDPTRQRYIIPIV